MEQAFKYINFKRLILEERFFDFGLAFFTITGLADFLTGSASRYE